MNVSQKELERIREALIPQVATEIPKGFYNTAQYAEMLGISKANVIRRLRQLMNADRIDQITGYTTRSNGRKMQVPYYRILEENF